MISSFSEAVFDIARITSTASAIEVNPNQGEDKAADIHTVTRNPLQTWIIQAGSWYS